MDPRLESVAKAGDIEMLYSLIKEDAYILEPIDEVPFIDTPLHIAASAGHVCFGLEIMRLKPSYARKLNHAGLSPIHVALQNEKFQMVTSLVEMDRELVQVQGREGKTPLHFAVEHGTVDVLSKFLSVCPKSILDLTISRETALHIAVKNDNLEALKVLLGWLDHVNKDSVLKLADVEGNTILHLATSRNQIEMVRLLIKRVPINAKNLAGLTALDTLESRRQLANEKLRRVLLRGGALKGSSLPSTPTLADTLKTKMSLHERSLVSELRRNSHMSSEERNTLLVVAVLFATANYQAVLSNPYMYSGSPRSMMMFYVVNNMAFIASMFEIYLYLPKGRIVLQLVLLLLILYDLLLTPWTFFIFKITFFLIFYYPKLLIILHKFIPISACKKSLEVRYSLFKHYRTFYREFEA